MPRSDAEMSAPKVHAPRWQYDCDRCKYSWCCGPTCSCSLKLQGHGDPPRERQDEVDAASDRIGARAPVSRAGRGEALAYAHGRRAVRGARCAVRGARFADRPGVLRWRGCKKGIALTAGTVMGAHTHVHTTETAKIAPRGR
jgi:hypothetical protein